MTAPTPRSAEAVARAYEVVTRWAERQARGTFGVSMITPNLSRLREDFAAALTAHATASVERAADEPDEALIATRLLSAAVLDTIWQAVKGEPLNEPQATLPIVQAVVELRQVADAATAAVEAERERCALMAEGTPNGMRYGPGVEDFTIAMIEHAADELRAEIATNIRLGPPAPPEERGT